MSSQRGNVQRSRPQKHRNVTVFKNDKYDNSAKTKKINAKQHDGVCQRCKDVLDWRVKYNKYKPLSQPKKCVKCLQKTVKDAYHIICKPCALQLELCAKCGKKEDLVQPFSKEEQEGKSAPNDNDDEACDAEDDLDFLIDLESSGDDGDDDDLKDINSTQCENTVVTSS
ncbi:uncharacterized protein C9orf85 homolog isoform X2 [Hyla sarda]|uniref:uncharacterized protein C9orf85 homolog isoform X2 n=1 Tax=Hyla sarda TaxID=327740 RepID=UPI0024C42D16|nr:uncharacterized protein C9orf85 homolog isoform X2 [Hyla sarda]